MTLEPIKYPSSIHKQEHAMLAFNHVICMRKNIMYRNCDLQQLLDAAGISWEDYHNLYILYGFSEIPL